jgi:AhpD family alkylhydroperoxidase
VTKRISLGGRASEPSQQLHQLHALVEKTAADAGLDQRLIELVKIRSSMLNGCAFCLDMHTRGARKLGETERRIYLLGAWRETDLYSQQECAALALTDAMTRLSETQDVSDEVYEQAVSVFTEDQYRAVAWTITVINAFNRLGVISRWKLPPEPQLPGSQFSHHLPSSPAAKTAACLAGQREAS